ncbi:MAG TPA: F0F1 ATP synthase subunit delta [Planctomycetia bacterium]|nr:F0F1 ATP synthase subunit delta [Planctomycetia bacterium]
MILSKRARREAKRLFRLCVGEDGLDENRAREVARRIAASGNRGRAAALAALLGLIRLEVSRHTAAIVSAAPLGEDQRQEIVRGLAGIYGPGVKAEFTVEPALIGGVRVQVGSDVYDGSVRARFRDIESSIQFGAGGAPTS